MISPAIQLSIILWTVFFTSSALGNNGVLEIRLSGLIYGLSRSIVTVESSLPATSVNQQGSPDNTVLRLVSSGLIYDSSGHIIVAASSVVGRRSITVSFDNQLLAAKLKAVDYQSGIALLEVPTHLGTPVRLSPQLGCAGQMVVAMGNSYGLRACPSLGFCAGSRPDGSMQFSAMITAGSVGGGLFDLSGRLLGVITGALGVDGRLEAGLAVPAHQIRGIVRKLIEHGDCKAGYIGLTTAEIEITPPIEPNTGLQLASGTPRSGTPIERGIVITNVVPFSPAARSGLSKGDLICGIDGQPVLSVLQLRAAVLQTQPQSTITLNLIRHNRPFTVPVTVGRRQLPRFPQARTSFDNQAGSVHPADSLLREIAGLKRAIMRLERRLR
jgi:S1-C subfamily serine protease